MDFNYLSHAAFAEEHVKIHVAYEEKLLCLLPLPTASCYMWLPRFLRIPLCLPTEYLLLKLQDELAIVS